jgi:hypothetical protein
MSHPVVDGFIFVAPRSVSGAAGGVKGFTSGLAIEYTGKPME